jgi:hypothetical protein
MAANKEPASIIAAQLRHADGGALAQRVYIHQLPQTAPRLAGVIEGVFGPEAREGRAVSAGRRLEGTWRGTRPSSPTRSGGPQPRCCWSGAMWQGQDSNLCRQCRRFYRSHRGLPAGPLLSPPGPDHCSDVHKRPAGSLLRNLDRRRFPRLRHGWVDGGYRGPFLDWTRQRRGIAFQVVSRSDGGRKPRWLPPGATPPGGAGVVTPICTTRPPAATPSRRTLSPAPGTDDVAAHRGRYRPQTRCLLPGRTGEPAHLPARRHDEREFSRDRPTWPVSFLPCRSEHAERTRRRRFSPWGR